MSSFLLQEDGTSILQETNDHLILDQLAIHLALSSNIPAAGTTVTTAHLQPPAGKTTADFQAGEISDDTNALPAIDLGNNKYTELEWCIVALDGANGDVYEFRVTANGTPLDNYGVTPQLTVVTGVTSRSHYPKALRIYPKRKTV